MIRSSICAVSLVSAVRVTLLFSSAMGSNSTAWSSTEAGKVMVTVVPTVFPRVGYSILSFLMFITTVLTVFNNVLVIAVIVKNSFLQPMNLFILSLAVSDLMIGLCGSLVVTITNYRGYFFIGHKACVFQGFAVNYFGEWTRTFSLFGPESWGFLRGKG